VLARQGFDEDLHPGRMKCPKVWELKGPTKLVVWLFGLGSEKLFVPIALAILLLLLHGND
jgi:hypothetical protein